MATWIGSEEHKLAFCRSFLETHQPFEPDAIHWPDLDDASLVRLRALPIWNEAVRTEASTAVEVQTLGRVEPDPLLARAISLQGYEEGRHAAILALLTRHYGIPVDAFDTPLPPSNPVWTFLRTGYGECLDSFFAFGLFAVGVRSGYFPPALTDIFDPILQEEARHILFIVNWAAYLRAKTPFPLRPAFDARRAWAIVGLLVDHARQAASFGGGQSQEGFTMASHAEMSDLSPRSFLELCVQENDRRLALYDPRLLRPRLVAPLARLALRVLPGGGATARRETRIRDA
ncbi:MAG TPA: ferritin-like domain-containing protein [Thermoanaerobaculia bacterium]|nr:ferritin-like domain-containing protein [Thermoanaerobaculia bacterium]